MRELDECKAEIFRRSKNRKKERREKRNRILAISIPLVICFIVFSVIVLMEIMPAKDNGTTNNGNRVCSYMAVEIENKKNMKSEIQNITDTVEIDKIFSVIHSIYIDAKEEAVPTEETFLSPDDSVIMPNGAFEFNGCVITFRGDNGSKVVYTLKENVLRNVYEDINVIINDLQLAELKTILGI